MRGEVTNMDEVILKLVRKLKELDALLAKVQKSLAESSSLPDGRIRISSNDGNHRFYYCERGQKNNGKYMHSAEEETARRIIQRDYDRKMEAEILRQKRAIERFLKSYASDKLINLYDSMSNARQSLVKAYAESDEMFVKRWLDEEYEHMGFDETAAMFITERGERVRSKTEKMLADKLFIMKIPYKYEKPLLLKNGIIVHPDYTLLNVRLRTEIYHEHLGMMDDEGYRRKTLKKIDDYIKSGIYPGRQLILTYETKANPLDIRVAELLYREFLL